MLCICAAGILTLPGTSSATYTFVLDSDDGSQLYIDNNLLIDDDGVVSSGRSESVLEVLALASMPSLRPILAVLPRESCCCVDILGSFEP